MSPAAYCPPGTGVLADTDDVTTLQAPERLRRLIRPFCGGKEVGESLRLMGSAFLANAELD